MAVSEAFAHLLYWIHRLWVMLLVTTLVVLVTNARSPKVRATICGKVIDWKYVNPCLEWNVWQEDTSQHVGASKRFFPMIVLLGNLNIDHVRVHKFNWLYRVFTK